MTQTGTLSGLGKLWDGNKDLGLVRYTLTSSRMVELSAEKALYGGRDMVRGTVFRPENL
jgi:hypothetical protein